MADKTISQLTGATTPLAGTEVVPLVQSSSTKKVSVSDLTAGRAISSLNVDVTGSTVPANGFYLPAANTVAIATNSGEKLRVDSNGNVGFGTQTPTVITNTATLSINSTANNTSGIVVHQNNGNQVARSGVLSGYYLFQDLGSANGIAIDEQSALPIRFNTNATERVRIESGGNVTVISGNIVIGTSGKGIDFSATAGTGTSELLNDYEEGIWSPTIIGTTTAGTATYDVRNTIYTKIGRLVHVEAYMVFSAGTGVGDLRIGNLPYAVENTYFTYTPIVCRQSSITVPALEQIYGRAEPGTSYITMYSVTDAGAQTPLAYDGDAFIAFQANYTAA